jgi:hypothetical protein
MMAITKRSISGSEKSVPAKDNNQKDSDAWLWSLTIDRDNPPRRRMAASDCAYQCRHSSDHSAEECDDTVQPCGAAGATRSVPMLQPRTGFGR